MELPSISNPQNGPILPLVQHPLLSRTHALTLPIVNDACAFSRPLVTNGMYAGVTPLHRTNAPDSQGGYCWIISTAANSLGEWEVQYVIGGSKEWVHGDRISEKSISQATPKRSSLFISPPPPSPSPSLPLLEFYSDGKQPLINLLGAGSKKPEGWHRLAEWTRRDLTGVPPKQLTSSEKVLLSLESVAVAGGGATSTGKVVVVNQAELNRAWGVSPQYAATVVKALCIDGVSDRGVRSDKGLTILTDSDYANGHVTLLSVYKRQKGAETQTVGTAKRYTSAEVGAAFAELTAPQLVDLEKRRAAALDRIANLPADIEAVLCQTNGSISWEDLHRNVGKEEVSMSAVRDYVMSLDGFSYKSTKTVPHLTADQKKSTVVWAEDFWIFWYNAKVLKLRIMLCHNDEKVTQDPRPTSLAVSY